MYEMEIGSSAASVEAGWQQKLAGATAAGDSEQVRVDLHALRAYYFKIKNILDDFTTATKDLPRSPFATQCRMTSGIPGVSDSIEATVDNALGDMQSMRQAMKAIREQLTNHLCALADTYTAYIRVDEQKSSELEGAGSSDVGAVNYPAPAQGGTASAQATYFS
jgi:hypothetical protein